jgi:hypothetical protein
MVVRPGLIVFAAVSVMGTAALAQPAAKPARPAPPPPPPATLVVTPSPISAGEALKLKMWLDTQTIASTTPSLSLIVSDGQVVPVDVPLTAVPAASGVTNAQKYRLAKLWDHVVVVDPATRKIVYIVS